MATSAADQAKINNDILPQKLQMLGKYMCDCRKRLQ